MENIQNQSRLISLYNKIKNSLAVQKINKIAYSNWGLVILSVLTAFAYSFALEIVMYFLVCIYTLYICLFCEDFLPLVPLFLFCYISPSAQNNPGFTESSIFYGGLGIAILIIAIICTTAILLRIGLDKSMGFKKLFTQKNKLTLGMLILGGAYILSGIFSQGYENIWFNNLVFAFLQFISIFLLYFILSSTIKWEKTSKEYLVYTALFIGIVICYEVLYIYLFKNVLTDGSVDKHLITTGWGITNNVAAMIALMIPFAFYLALVKQHTYIYFSIATLMLGCIVLTASRASLLVAGLIYLICFWICFYEAKNKKWFRITALILVLILTSLLIIFSNVFVNRLIQEIGLFQLNNSGDIVLSDANRFLTYDTGFNIFLNNPIFGKSFFNRNGWPYQASTVESFVSFFPARWHNTFIQIISSCGIVGLIAYAFHRYQTIVLFIKNPSVEKTFIALSIITLLIMSLLDCHFFNIGPVLFYSIMLAFAEHLYTKMDVDNKKESQKKE